jgi:general secretion pathway protein G
VNAHLGQKTRLVGERGFSFLELLAVITIISILAVIALDYYRKLLVDVERTSMQHDLGVMRSAIGLQVAEHFLAGNMDGLKGLVNSNPMDLLAEKPTNYLGVISHQEPDELETGSWYYDSDINALIYLVTNQRYFKSELRPAQARFKIYPVYSEKKQGNAIRTYQSGLSLKAMEPYRWLKTD